MNTQEAKFILSAYRPSGGDTGDAAFVDALRMAGEDPALGAWLSRSRAHDAAVAGKLREINPPQGLRAAILAGARVSGSPRRSRSVWGWAAGLAAAAAVAFTVYTVRTPAASPSGSAALASFAIDDMLHAKHGSSGEASSALVAALQVEGAKMPAAASIDFDRLRDTGCRTLNFAGHDVMEVCFARGGTEFHFYMTRRDGPVGSSVERGPSFLAQAAGAAAVWSDGRFNYALASRAGVEAVRRLL